ncbi:toll/interleukin-1 receptor domain-containing protein [Schaalia hyovaginalis]|uniref:TIR domain-containing protein n=1 Tax=Schaalia hyovaginalis TaxID=29316 RepID=A0A923E7G9_9ACTO|nr:toll/interleukin-1 receptor domain-containing protein [Schaalia hyovaginalis]MBB6335500.1 hypothetical protein [Schaalia hyovaginalis]MDY2669854.1 toll/interleukin-1 receptor domain-containing protein [Schaalia hyovaginalis]
MESLANTVFGREADLRVHSTILDIIILWHPDDEIGGAVCNALMDHYHSDRFSGFAGSAIEVFGHSLPFPGEREQPAPIITRQGTVGSDAGSLFEDPAPYTVILPVIGENLIRETGEEDSNWSTYLDSLLELRTTVDKEADPSVLILPLFPEQSLDYSNNPRIGRLLERQGLSITSVSSAEVPAAPSSLDVGALARDLGQAIIQTLLNSSKDERLTIFISHARADIPRTESGAPSSSGVLELTKTVIQKTHLADFVDAQDIQPGDDWDAKIRQKAGSGALLMVRTDHYSIREWTQWEVLSAKRAQVPIVCLSALENGEERGSFLLDHVPTIPFVSRKERRKDPLRTRSPAH